MTTATIPQPRETQRDYARLQERVLARDQVGSGEVFYDLIRSGRPLVEMLRELVTIHAPYTHVPYHQRIDNGHVRFVNNDHCLLSCRTSLHLQKYIGGGGVLEFLPLAQSMWYVPSGLDPWNQLLGKMPGHYNRRGLGLEPIPGTPTPEVHRQDAEPLYIEGTLDERLNQWLSWVQRGEVDSAYRLFLALLEEPDREKVLGQLVFAGLIDVQDRMLFNRSYTTGHKAYRARATVELGDAVGWENAHSIVYAGVPDMAVGPRWYSNYEMAGEIAWTQLAEEEERQRSSIGASPLLPPERRLLANEVPLTSSESSMLMYALTKAPDPAYIEAISSLLLAGKNPRQIVSVFQLAASKLILETGDPFSFSMSQHCAEYANTLGWFFDRFDHPHRLKLLYVAGSFICQTAHWLRNSPRNGEENNAPPREAEGASPQRILERLDDALVRRAPGESVGWVRAYLATGRDRKPLVRTLALGAAKQGNDTHNQELGLCFLEDYTKNHERDRDLLLMASAQHTAGHAKYGDTLEPFRRFAEAFSIDSDQLTRGDLDPKEALLD